jgi:uncharacterized membrane protein YfbV (UPF0208 family)
MVDNTASTFYNKIVDILKDVTKSQLIYTKMSSLGKQILQTVFTKLINKKQSGMYTKLIDVLKKVTKVKPADNYTKLIDVLKKVTKVKPADNYTKLIDVLKKVTAVKPTSSGYFKDLLTNSKDLFTNSKELLTKSGNYVKDVMQSTFSKLNVKIDPKFNLLNDMKTTINKYFTPVTTTPVDIDKIAQYKIDNQITDITYKKDKDDKYIINEVITQESST